MIRNGFAAGFTLALYFAANLAFASASQSSIDQVMALSGLTEQVKQYPEQIKVGFQQAKQQGTAISDTEFQALIDSVDQYISPTSIHDQIRNSLQKSLSEEEALHLLEWYRSPLGKEITQAEELASDPNEQTKVMELAAELIKDNERAALAKRLDRLVGATDMTMGIYEYSSIAVFSALTTAMNPSAPLNIAPLRAQMSANAAQTRSQIEQLITVSYIHTYKHIDLAKMKKYEAFLAEPTTTKLNRTVTTSMKQALETSISNWAESLAHIFKEKSK